jgi:hypothetical protein
VILLKWLTPWAELTTFVLSILALIFMLYIITKTPPTLRRSQQ